jgi:hypothetical protein
MDPATTGALIGIGILVCGVCTPILNDKGTKLVEAFKKRYQNWKQQRQPLLFVVKENPVLVRLSSKQFQMKELLQQR